MSALILVFIADLLGVFVGVYFALYLDRREKRRIENEERIKIARSLKIELEDSLERIGSGEKITIYELKQRRRNILLTRFNTAVLESVINSGKMTLLKSQMQSDLSNIHQILKLSEMFTNRVFDFMTSVDRVLIKGPMKTQIVDWLLDNLEAQYKTLENAIPEVLEDLKKEAKENESIGKTPKSFLKKCKNCGKEIPIASEICPFCAHAVLKAHAHTEKAKSRNAKIRDVFVGILPINALRNSAIREWVESRLKILRTRIRTPMRARN